ncbi:hypothetical protein, partial [Bordetella bronchiseptica]|uniref:hypothetical protein n=1 Tax=Bordetella bronchiseptica TaxID=518 RepID=UPI001F4404BA
IAVTAAFGTLDWQGRGMSLKGRVVNAILAAEALTPLGLVAALDQFETFVGAASNDRSFDEGVV